MSQSQKRHHSSLSVILNTIFGFRDWRMRMNSFSLTGEMRTFFSFEMMYSRFKEDAGDESGL